MFHKFLDAITGHHGNDGKKKVNSAKGESGGKIKGTVVLMKKNFLDFNDLSASVIDRVDELVGKRVSLQLVSAVNSDPTACEFFFFSLYSHLFLF